jgi:uncharacterized phage protein (TIGR01671 family)
MREIKFRAWDNVKNKIYYIGEEETVSFSFDSSGIVATDLTEHDWGFKQLEHLTYQQSTGLKDKNGNEIYEGDILRLVLIDYADIPEDIFPVTSEEFHEGICYLKQIVKSNSETDSVEVIGNIYENPELLKEAVQ